MPASANAAATVTPSLLRATPTAVAAVTAAPGTPTEPASSGPPICNLAGLSASAGWQGATGALAGAIRFLHPPEGTACVLQGTPQVALVTAAGELGPLTEEPLPAAGETPAGPVRIGPGETALVRFAWRNWCAPAPGGPISLRVTLPGAGSPVVVPVRDPSGAPLSDTPRCDNRSGESVLQVGPFELGASP